MSILNDTEIPIGFGMALAQNLNAMHHFSNLDDTEKKQIIEKSHTISSKEEMQHFVSKLDTNHTF